MEEQKNNDENTNFSEVIFLPSGLKEITDGKEDGVKEAIIKTMAFFDVFNYPLSSWEIYKFLYQNNSNYFKVKKILAEMVSAGEIETENGFYNFFGRKEILKTRQSRYNIADKKFKFVLRAIKWLRFLSGIEMIGVCNNLAYSNSEHKSDIDVFIIAQKNRIWITRFLVTTFVQFLGLRRHSDKVANKICLSFYVTSDNLNLKNIKLETDPYFYYWLATISPVYSNGIDKSFWSSNAWLKKFLPNVFRKKMNYRRRINFNQHFKVDKLLLKNEMGEFLEDKTKKFQLSIMSKNTNSVSQENDSRVIISDKMLKFHENDRRQEYKNKWLERIERVF